jgi:L-fuconolactonase
MTALQRDFLPADLKPHLNQSAVEGTVAVQAHQSLEETQFLLALAEDHHIIKGVVGWVDLKAEDLEDQLQSLSSYEKLRGFRHILQAEPPEFMLEERFQVGIKVLTKYDYTYDILIFPHQLKAATELVSRHPQQAFVLDHLAKPYIKAGKLDEWASDLWLLAQSPQVYCKLSGLITEADHQNWQAEEILPYLDIALAAFGVDRVMFGSDWPVCQLAGTYQQVVQLMHYYLDGYPQEDLDRIWGLNAIDFYKLTT